MLNVRQFTAPSNKCVSLTADHPHLYRFCDLGNGRVFLLLPTQLSIDAVITKRVLLVDAIGDGLT